MSPVFSVSAPFMSEERGGHHLELQLVPDEELMDIWEQTQKAVWMLEEKGWDSSSANQYCEMLVWEMQRRLVRLPMGRRFGGGKRPPVTEGEALDVPDAMPQIVTVRI